MQKKLRELKTLFFLSVLIIFSSFTKVYADGLVNFVPLENQEVIKKISYNHSISLWHYSGGYWSDGNVTIPDNIEFLNPNKLDSVITQKIDIKIPLSDEVKQLIASGQRIDISCSTYKSNMDINRMFYTDGSKEMPTFTLKNGELIFTAYPRFNFSKDITYKNLIPRMINTIPIADSDYGTNTYAIWTRSSQELGRNYGFFNLNNLNEIKDGQIHPSQILNANGELEENLQLKIEDMNYNTTTQNSTGKTIGYGTFKTAGAVGIYFEYPMEITFYKSVEVKNDVEVTNITPNQFNAGQNSLVNVTIKNSGEKEITTSLNFFIKNIIDKTEMITLKPGESKDVPFTFIAPASGPISMIGHANKEKSFDETNFDNNRLEVIAQIENQPKYDESKNCSNILKWNEIDSHIVYYTKPDGSRGSYICTHLFTYETKLTTTHNIDSKVLKSGYGFAVTLNNSISTRLVFNAGCSSWGAGRANTKIPVPPTKAEVRLPWKVTNTLGTQSYTVYLNKITQKNTTSGFEPLPNPISEVRAKKIYTDVAMKGTKTAPAIHNFTIYISGGGVNGVEFCNTINESITINGNMYEDDYTGGN